MAATPVVTDTCGGCGFDASEYTHEDLLGTLRAVAPMWRTMTEGVSASILAARPVPDRPSAIEHAARSRDTVEAMVDTVECALTEDAPVTVAPSLRPSEPDPVPPLADSIVPLADAVARLYTMAGRMGDSDWARRITVDDETVDVTALVGHAVHETTHHLRDVGRGLHALGAGAPRQRGELVQVNVSNGGVPKTALPSATIGRRGLVGDQQAERQHHGRPLQALCLWSQDVIDALQAEGHPVNAGAAGENLTLAGIDWTTIRPGVRLSVGDALVEISAFATPCVKNAQWFADGKFRRIDHGLNPGWSRAYAWVLEGGTVAPGAPVVVEP
jgi:MOSC domain-containing protein YiiM